LHAIQGELEALHATAADWAYWDDTYTFAQGSNPNYIAGNLTDSSFANLKLNLIVILNSQNQMVYGQSFDLVEVSPIPLPNGLAALLQPGSPLLDLPALDSAVEGLVMVETTPLLVVSLPILTNEILGPSEGTLIFGRYLEDAYVSEIAATYQFNLSAYVLAGGMPPPGWRRCYPNWQAAAARWCSP
jgi:sensor domain CHASE-containing protein